MRISRSIKIIVIISVFVVTCFGVLGLLRNGCLSWGCAPKRAFTIYDLNIPREYFPVDAQYLPLARDRGYPSLEEAVGGARWTAGSSTYLVQRFATTQKASEIFGLEVNRYTLSQPARPNETNTALVNYSSNRADEYQVGCGYRNNELRCQVFSRYEEFYIYLESTIDEYLTHDDFLRLAQFIDNQITLLLEK